MLIAIINIYWEKFMFIKYSVFLIVFVIKLNLWHLLLKSLILYILLMAENMCCYDPMPLLFQF